MLFGFIIKILIFAYYNRINQFIMKKLHFILPLFLFCVLFVTHTSCQNKNKEISLPQIQVDDILLTSDIKIPVSKGEASEFQPREGINNSFDGDYSTIYHSPWRKTTLPVTLTYYFENADAIDYATVYTRDNGINGNFMEFDLYIKSVDTPEKLLGSYNFQGISGSRNVQLNIKKPEYVKFVVRSGVGGFVSCAEVEFYKLNTKNTAGAELFTDGSYSALKEGVKLEQIEALESVFLKGLATMLYNKAYEPGLKIQKYKAILSPEKLGHDLKIGNGFSRYENITGIFLEKGKALVFVGPTNGKIVRLMLPNWMRQPTPGYKPTEDPNGWGLKSKIVSLKEGVNVVDVEYDTNAYINYFDDQPDSAPEITVHFATGKENGYFDSSIHSDEDWNKLLDDAVSPIMDAKGKYIQVAYPVEYFKKFTYGRGSELINNYDKMLLSHYTFIGLAKYNKIPQNKILARVNFNYYMFRDGDGVAYLGDENTMRMVADPSVVIKGDPCWGFCHEVGHVLQMFPQLNWGGLTEVSNNIYTLYTTTGLGNDSRLQESSKASLFENKYVTARRSIIDSNPKISYLQDEDVFHRLVPFWQLHLYFKNNGKPDFYADLIEQLRNRPDVGIGNGSINNQFEFIKLCCDIGETDLTDFFDKWGFFYVGKIELNDYGMYKFNVTQKQVDDTKAYIKAKNYKKPEIDITTIDDLTYKK